MKIKWFVIVLLLIAGSVTSFNLLSGNKYSALAPYTKKLPFAVYVPGYIPAEFSFQKEETVALNRSTNIGIPQFNLLYLRKNSGDAFAFRQFDRTRYQKDILDPERIPDFNSYFKNRLNIAPTISDGKEIYVSVSEEKKRTVFGDWEYIATGYFLRDDSLIQINYSGTEPITREEIVKIILSFKPF